MNEFEKQYIEVLNRQAEAVEDLTQTLYDIGNKIADTLEMDFISKWNQQKKK